MTTRRSCAAAAVGVLTAFLGVTGCSDDSVKQTDDSGVQDAGNDDMGTSDSGVDLDMGSPDLGNGDAGIDLGSGDAGSDAGGPSIVVSSVAGSAVENGTNASFTVRLSQAPTAPVAIPLSISGTQAMLSAVSVVFTASDWQLDQTVTVSAVDDFIVDGTVNATVTVGPSVSSDLAFASLSGPSRDVAVLDDDVVGIAVQSTAGGICDVTDSDQVFNLRLTSQPSADVIVPLSATPSADVLVNLPNVTFTPANWNLDHPVTITYRGGDKSAPATGNLVFGTPSSTDIWYSTASFAAVPFNICDAGGAGILARSVGGAALTGPIDVDEAGFEGSFEIVLASAPTEDVTLSLWATDADEITFDRTSVVFTPSNWNVPQIVTIAGIDDLASDGAAAFDVHASPSSGDPSYDGQPDAAVAVVNHSVPANVALNRPATVTNCGPTFCSDNCTGTKLTDASTITSCEVGDAGGEPAVVTIDLGSVYNVRNVELTCDGSPTAPTLLYRASAGDVGTAVGYTNGVASPLVVQARYFDLVAGTLGAGYGIYCTSFRVNAWLD